MILGNTFLFGALKEYSKGAVPCILAHMLIDSLAVLMLVQSSLPQIILPSYFRNPSSLLAGGYTKIREIELYLFRWESVILAFRTSM